MRLLKYDIRLLRREDFDAVENIVAWNDWQRIRFFSANAFQPAKTINLEKNL